MKIKNTMRTDMLARVRTALLDGTADQLIKFKTSAGTTLCEMPFDDLESTSAGDRVSYKFKLSGSDVLRGACSTTGNVSYFIIQGKVPTGSLETELIRGSVGPAGSSADIRFNRISWSEATTITITALSIILNQGS